MPRPADFVTHQRLQLGAGSFLCEHGLRHTVPRHVITWEIDAACKTIPRDVLPEVDELEPSADRIRHASKACVVAALERQHDPPYGIRRPPAVVHQLGARGVASLHLVLLEGIDQVGKGFVSQRGLADRFRKRDKDRMARPASEALVEAVPPCGQSRGGLGR